MNGASRVEKVKSALQDTSIVLESILAALVRDEALASHSFDVWRAYAKMEYCVALLKLQTKLEEPGLLKHSFEEGKPLDLLVNAVDKSSQAKRMVMDGCFEDALKAVREARNSLKTILIRLRSRR